MQRCASMRVVTPGLACTHEDGPRHRGPRLHRFAHRGRTAGARLPGRRRRQPGEHQRVRARRHRRDRRQEAGVGERRPRRSGRLPRVPRRHARPRRHHPLRCLQGGRRVGAEAARVLPQQLRQPRQPARVHRRAPAVPADLQLVVHRLRPGRHAADPRRRAGEARGIAVRQHQAGR